MKYYRFLDGFRAFSVFWVIWHHTLPEFNILQYIDIPIVRIVLIRLSAIGFLGVDVFFVISGFLITGLLLDDLNDRVRMKRFYVRRFFKIVPHYMVILAAGFLLLAAMPGHVTYKPQSVISYFLFFQNYVDPIPIFGHLWSIAVEEHFYFLYPALLAVICRSRPDFSGRRRLLITLLLGLIIVGNVIRWFAFRDVVSTNNPLVWQVTHVRFDGLMFGCLLRVLEKDIMALGPAARKWAGFLLFVTGTALFTAFVFKFSKNVWYYYTLAYVASGSLIVSGLLDYQPLVRLNSIDWLRFIGRNSYGIYLWHYMLKFPLMKLTPYLDGPMRAVVFWVLSVAFGVLTTVTVEQYFLRLRKQVMP